MQAGTAHCIDEHATYLLYENQASFAANTHFDIMVVDQAKDNETILRSLDNKTTATCNPPSVNASGLLALQVFAGEDEHLPVYAAADNNIYPMLQALIQRGNVTHRPWQIKIVGENDRDAGTAFIGLQLDEEGRLLVDILNEECCSYGMGRLAKKLQPTNDHNLSDFLEGVTFFWRHMKQKHSFLRIQNGTQIEFSELVRTEEISEDLKKIWKPKTESNDGSTVVNLIRNDKIELNVSAEAKIPGQLMTSERYGLTIRNNLNYPLYASVFFFSVGNFEISKSYRAIVLFLNS
jgi:hypothetical protein